MKFVYLVFPYLLLAACATTTATQLGHNTHRIESRSNGMDVDETESQDKALLKAAEATLDAGHRYFVIDEIVDKSITTKIVTPETTVTRVDAMGGPVLGMGVVSAQSTSTIIPGSTTEFKDPNSDTIITTFAKRPSADAYDAREIAMYYGPRLNPLRWGFSTPSKKLPPLNN